MMRIWLIFAWAGLWAAPMAAHALYVLPQKFHTAAGETIVVSVHNGDAFPQGDEAPDPSRLVEARLVTANQTKRIEDFRVLGKATHGAVRLEEAGSGWLAVRTRAGLLTLEASKFESYLREEGLQRVIDWRAAQGEAQQPGRERYSKYAKALVVSGSPDGQFSRVLGLEIEFVLEADPAEIGAGGELPVRLLWHGKPAAGIQVETAWADGKNYGVKAAGRTGADGRISIRLERRGRWRLHAVAMERTIEKRDADWESYWATVTFEIGNTGARESVTGAADGSGVR